jgi:hypothetical protein
MEIMKNSILEITDSQYCIRLSRAAFDLSLVHQLLKRIQAEQRFFSKDEIQEEDIISRSTTLTGENFDRLCEK